MKNNKEVKISYWAAHLTTTVSVTLVLLLLGIIALTAVSVSNETRRLREQLEVSVITGDSITDARAAEIAKTIAAEPFARNVTVITKEKALANWQKDTGENLETLFGVNPLSPEITFNMPAAYSVPDSVATVGKRLRVIDGVQDVALPDTALVDTLNGTLRNLAIILGIIALVMTVISFVLINNTVHLAIYARRFTIHTMQLVGATNGFIRRPYIANNSLSGLVAGLVSAGILAVALAAAPRGGFDDIAEYIPWPAFGIVAGSMIFVGIAICAIAAWMATSRYLKLRYNELFK